MSQCTSPSGYHILKSIKKQKRLRTHFKCNHPSCTHTVSRKLAHGRKYECPFCGTTYVASWKSLNLAFPHCDACTLTKKQPSSKMNKELEDLFKVF